MRQYYSYKCLFVSSRPADAPMLAILTASLLVVQFDNASGMDEARCYASLTQCAKEAEAEESLNVHHINTSSIFEFCWNQTHSILPCLADKVSTFSNTQSPVFTGPVVSSQYTRGASHCSQAHFKCSFSDGRQNRANFFWEKHCPADVHKKGQHKICSRGKCLLKLKLEFFFITQGKRLSPWFMSSTSHSKSGSSTGCGLSIGICLTNSFLQVVPSSPPFVFIRRDIHFSLEQTMGKKADHSPKKSRFKKSFSDIFVRGLASKQHQKVRKELF